MEGGCSYYHDSWGSSVSVATPALSVCPLALSSNEKYEKKFRMINKLTNKMNIKRMKESKKERKKERKEGRKKKRNHKININLM